MAPRSADTTSPAWLAAATPYRSVPGWRAGTGRHWTFVRSGSVYTLQDDPPGADESAELPSPLTHDAPFSWDTYGQAKVACERQCAAKVGQWLHISRPGLIAGRGDPSDRFGYWPAAFARSASGAVLVPDIRDVCIQVIAVSDLAR